jgi:hypothetical protein
VNAKQVKQEIIRHPDETNCDVVDRLPPLLRQAVGEYGFSVVMAFVQMGITDPKVMRHLVQAVRLGARERGNERPWAPQHRRVFNAIDTWLIANGAGFPAVALARGMREAGYIPVSLNPSLEMTEASMAEVTVYDPRLSKMDKHFRRLQAALGAADKSLWGAQ